MPIQIGQKREADFSDPIEYFRHFGPRHTGDEEESLFPRMQKSEAGAEALRSIESLHTDQVVADRAHAEIDTLGKRWLRDGQFWEGDAAQHIAPIGEEMAQRRGVSPAPSGSGRLKAGYGQDCPSHGALG
jgi:hypothetical protein